MTNALCSMAGQTRDVQLKRSLGQLQFLALVFFQTVRKFANASWVVSYALPYDQNSCIHMGVALFKYIAII